MKLFIQNKITDIRQFFIDFGEDQMHRAHRAINKRQFKYGDKDWRTIFASRQSFFWHRFQSWFI